MKSLILDLGVAGKFSEKLHLNIVYRLDIDLSVNETIYTDSKQVGP